MPAQTPVIIPADDPSVFAALNTLVMANSTKLAIIRPQNPPPGIAGFIMDIVTDDTIELESSVTDYTTSENNPIQDHIALMPEIVTVSGDVAEVVQTVPTTQPQAQVKNPLPIVPGLEPQLTPGAASAQEAKQMNLANAQTAADTTDSLWGYYNSRLPQQPNQTKQSLVYGYIYQLWKARQLFSVETPWGIMNNMVIQSATTQQNEQSKWVSTFSITFKHLRIAETLTVQPGKLAGRAFTQQQPETNNGASGQSTLTTAAQSQVLNRIAFPNP